jgi:hypothetical protein
MPKSNLDTEEVALEGFGNKFDSIGIMSHSSIM